MFGFVRNKGKYCIFVLNHRIKIKWYAMYLDKKNTHLRSHNFNRVQKRSSAISYFANEDMK